jgi:hypothetical protein
MSDTTNTPRDEQWDCALVQDALPLYLDGEVSPDTRSLIAEHLSTCPRCAGFLAGAQSVRAQVRRERPPHPSPPPSAPKTPPQQWSMLRVLGVALLIIGGMTLAFNLFSWREPAQRGSGGVAPYPISNSNSGVSRVYPEPMIATPYVWPAEAPPLTEIHPPECVVIVDTKNSRTVCLPPTESIEIPTLIPPPPSVPTTVAPTFVPTPTFVQ